MKETRVMITKDSQFLMRESMTVQMAISFPYAPALRGKRK